MVLAYESLRAADHSRHICILIQDMEIMFGCDSIDFLTQSLSFHLLIDVSTWNSFWIC